MHSSHSLALIATSQVTQSIPARIDTIAASESTVLLIGETGVGKELITRMYLVTVTIDNIQSMSMELSQPVSQSLPAVLRLSERSSPKS